MAKKESYVTQCINESNGLIVATSELIKSGKADDKVICDARVKMNQYLISGLFGAEIVAKEGKGRSLKLNHSLPTQREILTLSDIAEQFEALLDTAIAAPENLDDDMSVTMQFIPADIPNPDKIKVKKVSQEILSDAILSASITRRNCLEMAALAVDLRKKYNTQRAMIIGGISLGVIATIVGGVLVVNHMRKDKDGVPVDDDFYDDVDLDDDDDDIPHVDLGPDTLRYIPRSSSIGSGLGSRFA